MNPKLAALYNELPWLRKIADEIGNPSVVKVKRLDYEDMNFDLWTGQITTLDDYYYAVGYFVDGNGNYISPIAPPPVSWMRRFVDGCRQFWSAQTVRKNDVSVEQALRDCPSKDAVRFIVRFGHDLPHYGQLQLYVYKMPLGVTATEFLHGLDEARVKTSLEKQGVALTQVKQELSE